VPRITSSDNPRVKRAIRLVASSRERAKTGQCVLEGEHLLRVFRERHGAPETVIVVESALEKPAVRALLARIPARDILIVPEPVWADFAQIPVAIGVVAVVRAPTPAFRRAAGFCLLLEDVQDPGNVGSILRSAAAAGVAQVFLSGGSAFAWSPKVLRSAQGAHFHLEIFEDIDLPSWAGAYDGTLIATVAREGDSVFSADYRGRIALAIGNEGSGLSEQLLGLAHKKVTIPMPGGFESLNAAAAAAVCLFECVRQRGGSAA
jgi:RNA methyltransferase, TrmH family